jgi:hypothetical protein
MIPPLAAKTSGPFRLRWRGYDPGQVDEFLDRTAADRRRIEEDLAQLETFIAARAEECRRRDYERLTLLQIDVASCLEISIGALHTATEVLSTNQIRRAQSEQALEIVGPPEPEQPATMVKSGRIDDRLTLLQNDVASCLEASIGALRTATEVLSKNHIHSAQPKQALEVVGPPEPQQRAAVVKSGRIRLRWRPLTHAKALVASVALLALVPASFFYRSISGEAPLDEPASAALSRREAPLNVPASTTLATPLDRVEPKTPTGMVAHEPEGLVLTITATRECWIRTYIDGGTPLERLMKADETIMLRANDEVVLRIGDASALSLLINTKPGKPLGAKGQVVTTRITRSNYLSMLAGGSTT